MHRLHQSSILLITLLVLLATACTEPNPRPPTLPTIDEGGPELPAECPPRLEARAPGDAPGAVACSLGDIDRDRVPDLALGLEGADGTGVVWIASGRNGLTLFEVRGERPGGRFGAALAAAGDADRDGVRDWIVGAPGARQSDEGRALLISGADGSVLHELRPEARAYGFGESVAGLGDVDQDGHPDVAVGSLGPELATVFSGLDGHVLYTLAGEAQYEATQVLGPGDVDGDGYEDLALGIPAHVQDDGWLGLVRVVSVRDQVTRLEALGTTDSARFGAALAHAGDVDHDGVPDLIVGAPPFGARVISGADGATLRELADRRPGAGLSGLGASVATIGDLDDDQTAEFAVGREDLSSRAPRHGVAIFSGAQGLPLGQLEFGVDRARVAAAGDLDLDGIADLLVAFPELGIARVYSGSTMSLLLQLDPLELELDDLGMEVQR